MSFLKTDGTKRLIQHIKILKEKLNIHIENKSNPHEVNKEQIGLGNVENYKSVSVSKQSLTNNEKTIARENIGAGTSSFSGDYNDLDNIPNIPSKISELENDDYTVKDKNYTHTDNNFTNNYKSQIEQNTLERHNHLNKIILDNITASYTTEEKNKLSSIENGAEVNINADWNSNDGKSKILNKPTALSSFSNDEGFITNTVNNLSNYYNKTITYTKDEINTLINNIVTLTIDVVDVLPIENISTTTIYLVPKDTPDEEDIYNEFININGTVSGWEHIGNTGVDLSNYYTISQIDKLLTDKVDKISGKVLSSNDFTNTLLNKLNGIENNAQVNTINGVKGENETTYRDGNVNITKDNIGLGNVPNVTTNNQTPTFTNATTRTNIVSGETLSTLFGKIMKWFSDLGSLAFKSIVDKSDLSSSIQTSLNKADSALQSYTETDPTVPDWAKADTKPSYTKEEIGLGNIPNAVDSTPTKDSENLVSSGGVYDYVKETSGVETVGGWKNNENSLSATNSTTINSTTITTTVNMNSNAVNDDDEIFNIHHTKDTGTGGTSYDAFIVKADGRILGRIFLGNSIGTDSSRIRYGYIDNLYSESISTNNIYSNNIFGNSFLKREILTATCSTTRTSATKTATCSGYKLDYSIVRVKFTSTSTSTSTSTTPITININSTGAMQVYTTNGEKVTVAMSYKYMCKNRYIDLLYDAINEYWVCLPLSSAFYYNPSGRYDITLGRYSCASKQDVANVSEYEPLTLSEVSSNIGSIESLNCFKLGSLIVLSGIFTPKSTGIGMNIFNVADSAYRPQSDIPIVCSTYTSGCGCEGTLTTDGRLLFNFSGIANSRFYCTYAIK